MTYYALAIKKIKCKIAQLLGGCFCELVLIIHFANAATKLESLNLSFHDLAVCFYTFNFAFYTHTYNIMMYA